MRLSYYLQTLFYACCLCLTDLPLLRLIKEPFLGPEDGIVRDFLNVDMVCQVLSSDIASFCVYMTIIDEF